jgi:hypothetical protein
VNDVTELKGEFTRMWMDFAAAHEREMNIGDWAHLFAVLTGSALAMADVEKEKVDDILEQMRIASTAVFEHASTLVKSEHPLQ